MGDKGQLSCPDLSRQCSVNRQDLKSHDTVLKNEKMPTTGAIVPCWGEGDGELLESRTFWLVFFRTKHV